MWSKDIVFLISDGYSEGAQAWLDSYHGFGQSSAFFLLPLSPKIANEDRLADLEAEPLKLTTGSIWASLGLDYPHHSFSHIGLYYG
jgi:glycosylphosphatidylinositol transamidase